jgi:hypothetical protein
MSVVGDMGEMDLRFHVAYVGGVYMLWKCELCEISHWEHLFRLAVGQPTSQIHIGRDHSSCIMSMQEEVCSFPTLLSCDNLLKRSLPGRLSLW